MDRDRVGERDREIHEHANRNANSREAIERTFDDAQGKRQTGLFSCPLSAPMNARAGEKVE
jgi:hypothetical protein